MAVSMKNLALGGLMVTTMALGTIATKQANNLNAMKEKQELLNLYEEASKNDPKIDMAVKTYALTKINGNLQQQNKTLNDMQNMVNDLK